MKKILLIVTLMLAVACSNKNITKDSNKFIITPDKKYYIQYDKSLIELTPETYITKDKKLVDYLTSNFLLIKNPFANSNLVNDLSKYFTYPILGVVKETVDASNAYQMPVFLSDTKTTIDTVELANLLKNVNKGSLIKVENTSDLITKQDLVNTLDFKDLKIHILNANGINGIAKKTGDSLKKALEVNYLAENYSEKTTYSYLASKELDDEYLLLLAEKSGLKNVKVDNTRSTDGYAATLIIGKSLNNKYPVEIISDKEKPEILTLLNKGYETSISKNKPEDLRLDDNNIYIYYNPEDILIAKQIEDLLPKTKLEANEKIKNKIVITTKR